MSVQKQNMLIILLTLMAGAGAGLSASNTYSQSAIDAKFADEVAQRQIADEKQEHNLKEWVSSLLSFSIRERDQQNARIIQLENQLADAREQIAELQGQIQDLNNR